VLCRRPAHSPVPADRQVSRSPPPSRPAQCNVKAVACAWAASAEARSHPSGSAH
jgi:hypothetical protein